MSKGTVEGIRERIREAREAKQMTQAGLAKFLEISRTAITQWEAGLTFPSYEKCIDLSRLLGVRPEWIAFGIDTPVEYRTPTDTQALPVIEFGDSKDARTEVGKHYLSADFVKNSLRMTFDVNSFVYQYESEAFSPRFFPGDHIIIDGSTTKVREDGLFLIWNGLTAQIVSIWSSPSEKGMLRVATTERGFNEDGRHYEAKMEDLEILGRVRGRLGKSWI